MCVVVVVCRSCPSFCVVVFVLSTRILHGSLLSFFFKEEKKQNKKTVVSRAEHQFYLPIPSLSLLLFLF